MATSTKQVNSVIIKDEDGTSAEVNENNEVSVKQSQSDVTSLEVVMDKILHELKQINFKLSEAYEIEGEI